MPHHRPMTMVQGRPRSIIESRGRAAPEAHMKSIPELRAAERRERRRAEPARATDTVIVKLKISATAARRLATAAGLSARRGPAAPAPFVARLIEAGYAAEVVPIFPAPLPLTGERRPGLAMAAAVAETERPLRRARGWLP
jgi:hypothetical protein